MNGIADRFKPILIRSTILPITATQATDHVMQMENPLLTNFLANVAADVAALPTPAVQLVGALTSLQQGTPEWLEDFIMTCLGNRVDMNNVSPAAEAVMRLRAFSDYSEFAFAKAEILSQHQFLKSIALEDKVFVAAAFMNQLADRLTALENALQETPQSRLVGGLPPASAVGSYA